MADTNGIAGSADLSHPCDTPFVPDIGRLEQHFLNDPARVRTIAAHARIGADDVVADLGAGSGVLTMAALAHGPARVIAVELDRRCARWLEPMAAAPSMTLVWADLRTALVAIETASVVLANPPFTLMHQVVSLLRAMPRLQRAVLITGKRWARAAVAPPGTIDYRRSSLHIQSRFRVEVLGYVPGDAFMPAIRQPAAVVRLTRRRRPDSLVDLVAELDLHQAQLKVKEALRPRDPMSPEHRDRLHEVLAAPTVRAMQQRRLQQLTTTQLSNLMSVIERSDTAPTPGSEAS